MKISEKLSDRILTVLAALNADEIPNDKKVLISDAVARAEDAVGDLIDAIGSVNLDGGYKIDGAVVEQLQSTIKEAAEAAYRKPNRQEAAYRAIMASIRSLEIGKEPSRAERRDDATAKINEGVEGLRELAGEYEEWRDNLPENLQSSNLYETLDSAANDLSQAADDAESAQNDAEGVELPTPFNG